MTKAPVVVLLGTLLGLPWAVAQEPETEPAGEATPDAAAAAAAAESETPSEETMPVFLRDPLASPFAAETVLEARKLRGLNAEVATLILQAQPGGQIAIEALATPLRGSEERAHVPVFVEIDGVSFMDNNEAAMPLVELYAYALEPNGKVAGYLTEVFAVDVEDLGEAVWQQGLKYYGHLDLPPGSYKLRVLVRNRQSKAAALRETPVEVPALGDPEQVVLFPIFPGPSVREAWLPVRSSGIGPDDDDAYPFVVEGQAISPAARPVLVTRRPSHAHLVAYNLPGGELVGRVELLREEQVATTAPLEILGRHAAPSQGAEIVDVRFELPELATDLYPLRVALEAKGQQVRSASISVFVLGQSTRERELLWTDLRWQLAGAEPPDAASRADREEVSRPGGGRIREEDIRELAAGYRTVLSTLAKASSSAARGALLDLESNALAEGFERGPELLHAAEFRVAEQLAGSEVESIIPVILLHTDIYQTYRSRRLFSLSYHARALVESLAQLYAEQGGSQGSRIVAARALASLAGHQQEANLPASSRRLFQAALELDPQNKAAILGLAASYEKFGEYRQACDYLEQLVAAYPNFGEGLLRLAMNLKRVGGQQRSRELLAAIVEMDVPAWVRSLAFQEQARNLLESAELAQAVAVMERSIEEIGPHQGSVLLLAHLYDRTRRPYESLELLGQVRPNHAGFRGPDADRRESARMVYDSWPRQALNEVRRQLSEAAANRVAVLNQILENSGDDGK
ncbi:MAG: hypothetical protein GY856_38365 [bacterium]|nr:hypothetical protein [bacterium]